MKYQVIGLKILEWFNAWSQDQNMPYCHRAMELYNSVETAIVNSCIPQKYKMKLLTQEQVKLDIRANGYQEYMGYRASIVMPAQSQQASAEGASSSQNTSSS